MRYFFALLLSTFCFLAQAQTIINDPNVEVRTVEGFRAISVAGGIDLFLSAGDEAVAVSASSPEYRNRIKTEVKDGVLKIFYDYQSGIKISINSDRKLRAYVSYKQLEKLHGSGGCDITIDGTLKADNLVLGLSGGSDFVGKVDVNTLKVDQSGGCDTKISGRVGALDVDASGGSDFNGFDLVAETCRLDASGGCDIEITVTKELVADASGASDIRYRGSPAVKKVEASGSSSVVAAGRRL